MEFISSIPPSSGTKRPWFVCGENLEQSGIHDAMENSFGRCWLHLLTRAARRQHWGGGSHCSSPYRCRVWKSTAKVSSGMVPSERRGGRISSRLWLARVSLSSISPAHASLWLFFLFYKDTIRIGFGHILIDSWFHPPCKNPFPNEVTFWATGTRTLV